MKLLVDEMPIFPDDDCLFAEQKWEEKTWVSYCKLTGERCDLDEEQCSCLKVSKEGTDDE